MNAASSNTYISKRMMEQYQQARAQKLSIDKYPSLTLKKYTEDEEMKEESSQVQTA